MERFSSWRFAVGTYLVVGALVAFWGLGDTDVIRMEGIVADGARHFGRGGDWAVPTLYGELYSFKPPLAAWLAQLSFVLCGAEHEIALRLPFALSGLAAGLAVLLLVGRDLGPRVGLVCALAAITGFLTLQKLRVAEFDVLLAAGTGVATVAASAALVHETGRQALWLVAYLGLAFATLAKGLAAPLVFLPGLGLAAWRLGRLRSLMGRAHIAAATVGAGWVLVWLGVAWARTEGAVLDQPLAEARMGAEWSASALGETLMKPLLLLVVFFPWSPLLPFAASRAWRDGLDDRHRRWVAASWCFLIGGLGAHVVVTAFHARYLLPLAFPAGVLAGMGALRSLDAATTAARVRRRLLWVGGLLGAAGAAGAAAGLFEGHVPVVSRVLAASIAVMVLALVVRDLRSRPVPVPLLATAVALSAWATESFGVLPRQGVKRSQRAVAAAFDPHLPPNAGVRVDFDDSYSSLVYYLDRPVLEFDLARDTLPAGSWVLVRSDQEAALAERTDLDCREVARAPFGRRAFVLLRVRGGP